MSKPLVVFGTGAIAELVAYMFTTESSRVIAAFTVDEPFVESHSAFGYPLVSSSEVCDKYPPDKYDMFVAVSYTQLNRLRIEKYSWAKESGYHLPSYISPRATLFPDFSCGDNCLIFEDNTIQPFVTIGSNVTLWSGNHIGHHTIVEDDVFIASHVVISGGVKVGRGTFMGVNATIRDHITIGENCVIGAGTLILDDAEPGTLFRGEPSVGQDARLARRGR
ncbi:MAG: acetyltransferase [Candidatus Latescibacteria bacterium]|nr:acetyltransferase [Candidatus Latescibacterota bacterium]